MASFTSKLSKLLISSPKCSIPNHNRSSFRCDFGSALGTDKSSSFLSSSMKKAPTINLDNILSLNNISTFLIRSPQSIHKEKRKEYMMIFRNGSMKDLHRERYLCNLSTMKSNPRDDSVKSQKSIKFKVDKYSKELKDETKASILSIKTKGELSPSVKCRTNSTKAYPESSVPITSKYSRLLINYSKHMSQKKSQFDRTSMSASTANSVDMKSLRTSTSSFAYKMNN